MKAPAQLVDQIKRQEGCRLTAYQDTLGNWTIAFGHTPAHEGQECTQEEADAFLVDDLREAESEMLTHIPWVTSLDVVRYCTLWNMTFNEGIEHLLEFKEMLAAIRAINWMEASDQMMNSLWARQVKERAVELSEQMETGHWFNPEA